MTALNEHKIATLKTLTGATSGTVDELEILWLQTELSSSTGHKNGLWHEFFNGEAIADGQVDERAMAYLEAEGYTGTIDERWYQFWAAGGPSGGGGFNYLLLESGDFFLLESGDKLILE